MMRRALTRLRIGLARQHRQAFVDLKGIRTNNFAAELVSQLGGEKSFADRSRAGDDYG
jgi:hypothetical protein